MDSLRRPRPIWRIILVISLMLNIAGIGLLAGAAFKGRMFDGPPPRMSFGLGNVTDALDRADRRAIAGRLHGKMDRRRNGPEQRLQLIGILSADPFVAEDLSALLQARADTSAELVTTAQTAFVAHVAQMSNEERQKLAERIKRGRR